VKIIVFWDVALCSLVERCQGLEEHAASTLRDSHQASNQQYGNLPIHLHENKISTP
jgi:hypothetical protein